ncbi:MAG TPA: ABC transporter substrate-binding protein [Candidatus Paceibacterota bacterium]
MNKKSIVWLVVVIIAIAVIASAAVKKPSAQIGTLKVGVIAVETGAAAYIGVSTEKGIEIAKEELAAKHPDFRIETINEDSMFTPKGGIDAYNKLRATDNIDSIITMASNVSVAVEPLAAKDGILHVAASTLANGYTTPEDLSFRLTAKGDLEAGPALAYLKGKGVTKLGILAMQNEIGVSLRDSLKAQAADYGITIVIEENYPADATDWRTSLIKVRQAKPEALYLAALAAHSAQILKQADSLGFDPLFISYRATEDPALIKNAGTLAEKLVYTTSFDAENSQLAKDFAAAYKAKYDEEVNGYAAEAYESMKLTAESFMKCGKDYVCIKDYFFSIKNRPSVLGPISFDRNGDVSYPFIVKTVREGKFVKI